MESIRLLRAISWLRWQMLKNSVAGSRNRDVLEQASRTLALVVPVAIAALSIGTFIAVSVVAFMGGRAIGTGLLDKAMGLFIVRIVLGGMIFVVVALALAAPTQSTASRYTRLLLLPIPRRVLHLVEVASSLADPWLIVIVAGLLTFSTGLWIGGRPDAALAAFLSAIAIGAVLVCAASLTSFLVSWLMRSRKRGELFTLIFVLGFTLVSFIPLFTARDLEGRPKGEERPFVVQEFDKRLPAWTRYLPSEIYGRTVMAGMVGTAAEVATGVGLLLAQAGVLFVASARVHRRMLNSLEGDSGRTRNAGLRVPVHRLPGLSPAATAVAWAQFRGALRTVRGRLTILLPGPLLAMMTFAFRNVPQETWAHSAAEQGYLLLAVSIVFTLYSLHAVTMNLFGSDRAGLTLQLLSPVSNRELAWGKVTGVGMIVLTGVIICLAASLAVARSGPVAYWIATLLGGAATFLLICPVALWMSALFPVASDLSKTGAGGNPHPLPMIVGTICTVLFAAPAAIIVLAAELHFRSEIVAVPLMAAWLVFTLAVAVPLINLAARAIGARRENLALVAQGR
jgi:hypothetical protein